METQEQLVEIARLASENLGTTVVTPEIVKAVQAAEFEVRYTILEPIGEGSRGEHEAG